MYSDEELEAAVLRFLTSEVTLTRSETGIRDVEAVKAQVYELVSTAFMLRPDALFAVVWLATNRLRGLVLEQLADLGVILAAAPRVASTSARVEAVTDLRNAQASLLTLTAAFSARSSGVAGAIGPATQRFSASIGSFMEKELAKNVVVAGEVVETPEELRARVAERWAVARPRHAEIVASAQRVLGALADYASVRLPASVVASLLARIQARLNELTEVMAGTDAAKNSRQALLEFAAMRTLLKQAAQFRNPVLKKGPLTGDAPTGVGSGHAGVPASIVGLVSGPFQYPSGTILTYSVAGVQRAVSLPNAGELVAAADVARAFAVDGALDATVVRDAPSTFVGHRSAVVGEANVLLHVVVAGDALVAGGTNRLRSSSNLEALGVEPGMVMKLGSAPYRVTSVDGPTVELAETPPPGTYAYVISPDYTGRDGWSVQLSGTADAGAYRVVSGGVGRLVLASALASADPVQVGLSNERLRLTCRDVGVGTTLAISPGPGASVLGLLGAADPTLFAFDTRMDLGARGVSAGDLLLLYPSSGPSTHVCTGVEGTTMRVTPGVPADGAFVSFEVRDPQVAAYHQLTQQLAYALSFDELADTNDLDLAIGRLARGAQYNLSLAATLQNYGMALAIVQALCDGYVVPRDPTVEQALKLMADQGFDRAADLFTALELSTFFGLDTDGVSYKTWVVRTTANAAAAAVPVGKTRRDTDTTWQTVSVMPRPGRST